MGLFDNVIDAAHRYDYEAIKLFGEFACLNFPEFDYSQYIPPKEYIEYNPISKYYGVQKSSQTSKWEVNIKIDGKKYRIGSFNTEIDAAQAYDDYIIKNKINRKLNFVDFDYTNFIPNPSRNMTSQHKGVYYNKDKAKYCARININKKTINLGYYKTELEAAQAYDKYIKMNNIDRKCNLS